mmetsp:Transcript_17383/g.35305  ORF Transcript_17383/g.35305 Transcript_17383/m.35305 type:complete len:217 (-) Transcript_17383:407-1057(-)
MARFSFRLVQYRKNVSLLLLILLRRCAQTLQAAAPEEKERLPFRSSFLCSRRSRSLPPFFFSFLPFSDKFLWPTSVMATPPSFPFFFSFFLPLFYKMRIRTAPLRREFTCRGVVLLRCLLPSLPPCHRWRLPHGRPLPAQDQKGRKEERKEGSSTLLEQKTPVGLLCRGRGILRAKKREGRLTHTINFMSNLQTDYRYSAGSLVAFTTRGLPSSPL